MRSRLRLLTARRAAIEWILQNPKAAGRLYLEKVAHHFGYREALSVSREESRLKELLMLLTYYPLLALGCARFLLAWRWRLESWEIFAALLYLGFALVSAIFFTRIRFRLPMDLVLMLLAGSLLGRMTRVPSGDPLVAETQPRASV